MSLAFILLQFIGLSVLGSFGLPALRPPTPSPTTNPSGTAKVPLTARDMYDIDREERRGYFTGPWVPNTFTSFDRVDGVVEYCSLQGTRNFIDFPENLEGDYSMPVYSHETRCYTYTTKVRDFRKNVSQSIGDSYHMYFKSSNLHFPDGVDNSYPANKDVVWQIAVPQNYALILLLKTIDLEPPTDGGCINDFVSYYVDDEIPTKSCSSVDEIRLMKIDARKFTFRFKSNGAKNEGGFYAGVLLLHKDIISRSKKDTEDRSDDGFLDLPLPSNRVEQFLDDKSMTCFSHITEFGELAAELIIADPPTKKCKELAEKFLEQGYLTP